MQAALYIALAEAVRRISGRKGKGLLGFNPKFMVIGELQEIRRRCSRVKADVSSSRLAGMIVADIVTTLIQVRSLFS